MTESLPPTPGNGDLLKSIGLLALTARLRRLNDQLTQGVKTIYHRCGLEVDLNTMPILVLLSRHGELKNSDIADGLGISRARVSQGVAQMTQSGLVEETANPQDRRERCYSLSPAGEALIRQLKPVWEDFETLFDTLLTALPPSTMEVLDQLETMLNEQDLPARHAALQQRPHRGLSILTLNDPTFSVPAVRALFEEYQVDLGIPLGFQDFDGELDALPGKYDPMRNGQLFLAYWNGQPVGCAGIYQMHHNICEVKRVYVKPAAQGKGIGRALMNAAIKEAYQLGFTRMRLDSLRRLEAAAKLYQSLGFYEIGPYNHNPQPDVYYMEKHLRRP